MKRTRRFLSGVLTLILTFVVALGMPMVSHAEERNYDEGLISIEVIPNNVADALLPDCLYNAVALREGTIGGYSTNGLGVPSADSTWDLSSEKYSFFVNTSGSTIYSSYVFTGHGGSVEVNLIENTSTSGQYTFKLYKRGTFNTTLYTYKFDHGKTQNIQMSSFSSDEKIYFSITPNGYTVITSSSYIKKN